ncbi:MAG TPA: nitrous oxide reductase accessory protein NosL [Gemmatimonadales bacterium]|nr:nitrous oxide reductase accessory protein NosL [Gemmatimonadales bacterium]
MRLSGRGAALAVLAIACGAPRPGTIEYGRANCDQCHMTIAEPRFAAQLVTRTGKLFVFDDPGCLAAFVAAGAVPAAKIHSLWVNDFLEPDSLLDATRAAYLRAAGINTPMGSHVIATRPGPRADSLRAALGAEPLTWEQVRALPHAARHG